MMYSAIIFASLAMHAQADRVVPSADNIRRTGEWRLRTIFATAAELCVDDEQRELCDALKDRVHALTFFPYSPGLQHAIQPKGAEYVVMGDFAIRQTCEVPLRIGDSVPIFGASLVPAPGDGKFMAITFDGKVEYLSLEQLENLWQEQ